MTGVNYNTLHILGIAQDAAAEHHVRDVQGNLLFDIVALETTRKVSWSIIRNLTRDRTMNQTECSNVVRFRIDEVLDLLGHYFCLQVSLAVQVLGLNEALAFTIGRVEKHDVGRYKIILVNVDDIAAFDGLALNVLKFFGDGVESLHGRAVFFLVTLEPRIVFVAILGHTHEHNEE